MGCNCNHGCNGMLIRQGETFTLQFQYKVDDQPAVLPEGYDLIVGLYDGNGKLIQDGSYLKHTITHQGSGLYQMAITHESSMKMTGKISVEITIADENRTVVEHASDIVYIDAEYRKNNQLL